MNSEAALFLQMARSSLESVRASFEKTNAMTAETCEDFYKAHELPVKAVIVERGGGATQSRKITGLCKSIGLWAVIPPMLQKHLHDLESGEPEFSRPDAVVHEGKEWKDRLAIAPKFVFFIENQVLRSPTILKGITTSSLF